MVDESTRANSEAGPTEPAQRSATRSVLIVALLVLTTELFAYEFNMVSPALPDIAAAFQASDVSLVMTLVFLASAIIVPFASKLGDMHGKKRLLLLVVGSFVAGSLICALAPSYVLFLVGRVLQAVGLAATVITYGLVRDLLPPKWVPIGIGGLGLGFGASALIGPLVGGWLIDSYGFRSVFWFLLVYAVVMMICVFVFIPESTVRIQHRLDYVGGGLLASGIGTIIAGATVAGSLGVVLYPLGAFLLVAFVLFERQKQEPFMPVPLLRRKAVWMTLLCAAMIGAVTGAHLILMPLMLRTPTIPGTDAQGLGMTALEYGMTFAVPMGITAALAGFLAGWVSRRFGPRHGLLVAAMGWAVGAGSVAVGFADSYSAVVVIAVILGIGQGFFYSSANNLIIEAVPAKLQGVSASMKYTAAQGSSAISGAVVGMIIAADIVEPATAAGATVYGMQGFRTAYLMCAVLGLVAILVALAMRHGRTPATGGVAPDSVDAHANPETAPTAG